MYTNAGAMCLIANKRLIGIFDLETSSHGKATKEWLARAEKNGQVQYSGTELPLSVILVDKKINQRAKRHEDTVLILSQLAPKTLAKRSEQTIEQLQGSSFI